MVVLESYHRANWWGDIRSEDQVNTFYLIPGVGLLRYFDILCLISRAFCRLDQLIILPPR